MDKRLILSFLLVTLSLEFMATSAQSNATTVAPSSNATTVAPSSNATTVVPSSNATTVAPANNATTVAPANNATTVAPASNATTVAASNATTVAASNATTVAASNATTVAPNTLPAVATISRQECGSSKLCAAEPSECSPASGSCYFLSAKQQSGQNYSFELSGQSDGYIAAGVSSTASQTARHRAYICANNNGAVRFFTGFINNLVLNLTESLDSSNQRGSINSGKIQCTFSAVLPDTTTRAAGYSLSVTTGPYDSSSGQPGTASFRILTPVVNLSDPTANVSNLLSNSTSSAYPVTHTHSFLPVLLVTVSMLAFTTA
ncbi:putative ferric-chelate reductase 1 isoform X1 [Poeciliopsis prolifica]|uniref:putative ferric-chelate reductase 1 isoform X1 n=1 Tax=Poeciliopsis prolifica TaxID=188132 RepID=UPI002413EF2C|nr:putative ferric-chelate reductase 1 isoform X1 [Poeciliopsis prolifica]